MNYYRIRYAICHAMDKCLENATKMTKKSLDERYEQLAGVVKLLDQAETLVRSGLIWESAVLDHEALEKLSLVVAESTAEEIDEIFLTIVETTFPAVQQLA